MRKVDLFLDAAILTTLIGIAILIFVVGGEFIENL